MHAFKFEGNVFNARNEAEKNDEVGKISIREKEETKNSEHEKISELIEYVKGFDKNLVNGEIGVIPIMKVEKYYPSIEAKVKEIFKEKITQEHVQNFINAYLENLKSIEEENEAKFKIAGSAVVAVLINLSEAEKITLNSNEKVLFIGAFSNKKKIIVLGNAGEYVGLKSAGSEIYIYGDVGRAAGFNMKEGKIYVYGNAGSQIGGYMDGGVIYVSKNAGDFVGYGMRKGSIKIKNNAGNYVGGRMQGGKIEIYGNAGRGVGEMMENGRIIIYKDAEEMVGYRMIGGRIEVRGKINGGDKLIGYEMVNGEIIINGSKWKQ